MFKLRHFTISLKILGNFHFNGSNTSKKTFGASCNEKYDLKKRQLRIWNPISDKNGTKFLSKRPAAGLLSSRTFTGCC